jgi:hypothetical protein
MSNKIRIRNTKTFLIAAFLPVFLLVGQSIFGQSDTVKLRFSITDAYTKRGVMGASIVNRTTNSVAITDTNGYVVTRASVADQIYIVAPGYHAIPVSIADSTGKQTYFLHVAIEPFTAGLDRPVIITGNKTLDNIGQDKQHLGMTPPELKRPKIPVADVFGLLYDRVGARGKEREALKRDMVADDRWKVMTEYLNYCNEKELINLPKESYNDFINYCNMSVAYLKSHADYEILVAISHKFEDYAKEHGLVK